MTKKEPNLLSIYRSLVIGYNILFLRLIIAKEYYKISVRKSKIGFKKTFDQTDSVYVFELSSTCNVRRYGYAVNEESDFKIVM